MDATTDRLERTADEATIAALRAGDEAAFLELVERYQRPLIRLAMLHVPDRSTAEEVVQDTWIGVMKGLDTFEGRSSLQTWIFRIATYRAKTRGVREKRSLPLSALLEREASGDEAAVDPSRFRGPDDPIWPGHWSDPPASWGNAEASILAGETRSMVAAALDGLPAAQRLVMTLRDVDGWTSEEVCEALELSAANQRVLLHRARSKVRAALEGYVRHGGPVTPGGSARQDRHDHDTDRPVTR
jgi:RNA polymerase sigma-70 factor (ECF subfamily)